MNQNIWNVLNTTAYHFGRYWPKCVTWKAATPFPRIFRWFCLISAEHRKLIQSCKHKKLLKSVQPKRARAWKVTLIKSWASSQSALWVFVFELLRISQGTKLGHFSGCGCGFRFQTSAVRFQSLSKFTLYAYCQLYWQEKRGQEWPILEQKMGDS